MLLAHKEGNIQPSYHVLLKAIVKREKLVRKSYTPVVPIANTCSIGYPHDSRTDNAAYRHDRRADNAAYRHDCRADSLSPALHTAG